MSDWMFRETTRGWITLTACVVVFGAGCCKKNADEGNDIPTPMPSGDPGLEDPGESHRDSKIDRTIKCFNKAMRINKSASYYFERLRGGKPRAGRIPSIVWKPPADTNKVCDEAKSDTTPPMADIDEIMPRYVELAARLAKQLDAMDQYYKAKEYKTDKYEKGQEMHEVFKKDHKEFKKLHQDLGKAIDTIADQRDDESIAKAAKTKGLWYHSLVFLRDAKFLSREITKAKPDKKVFADLKTKLEASHKAFANYASKHPEQVSKAFMFSMYKGRADSFVVAVRDANPNKIRDRDLDNMLDKYNSMIDASNLVRWRN